MSAITSPLLTPEQYLAQERAASHKSAYYRGEVFAMAGASVEHTQIKDNFAAEARAQFKDGSCRALTSDRRVKVSATGLYTYPDMVIVCGQLQLEDSKFDTLLNPQVIVEVLSDSTEKYDRGSKFAQYRQIPSLKEYILIAQDSPLLERYVRQPDGMWMLAIFNELTATFELASVPVRIPLTEIYRGVKFPVDAGRQRAE
ncbi:MAG TPA: Uma2 family endonuclease [Tepidisphaeraceae bacterium]|nr:Uma2 family endonuclease [Tepidisphaeraceae bacterium]